MDALHVSSTITVRNEGARSCFEVYADMAYLGPLSQDPGSPFEVREWEGVGTRSEATKTATGVTLLTPLWLSCRR